MLPSPCLAALPCQAALADAAWKAVCDEYVQLETAITQPDKRAELPQFSQPFLS